MTDIFVRLSVRQRWPSWTAWWMFHLSAHQVTIELIWIDSLTPRPPPPKKKKHGVVTNLTTLRRKMTDLKHFQSTGGILDAIFRITHLKYNLFIYVICFGHTTQIRCKIVCFYFRGRNALCCKLTHLAHLAMLDAIIDFRLSDYQMTI